MRAVGIDLGSKRIGVAISDSEGIVATPYEVIERSEKRVSEIARAMKKADALYLATDPDREGEAISWHLSQILADRKAIKDWVSQVFKDAAVNKKEVYFGLKREFVQYDEVYSSIILEIRQELAALDTPPPSFMIMRPSRQLSKMICDPPRWGLYPAQNLDGDIFSDISAALGGSLATASSVIRLLAVSVAACNACSACSLASRSLSARCSARSSAATARLRSSVARRSFSSAMAAFSSARVSFSMAALRCCSAKIATRAIAPAANSDPANHDLWRTEAARRLADMKA